MGTSKDRLLDHAYGPVADELRSLRPNLLIEYQKSLDSVFRGQAKALRPYNSKFRQTNLVHTFNMLDDLQSLEGEYPEITKNVDTCIVQRQAILHDGPEALPGAHFITENGEKIDVPAAGDERESEEGRKMKRRESLLFIFIMLPKVINKDAHDRVIRDQIEQLKARVSYKRYHLNHPKDIETQVTKLLDGREGTIEAGLDGIFGVWNKPEYWVNGEKPISPPENLVKHLELTVPKMIRPFCNLARELPKPGRLALSNLLRSDLEKLASAGYDELAHYTEILYQPLILYPY